MLMTNDEICVQYRHAKNKERQIKILAELNVTTKQEIIEVLKQGGMVVPEQKPPAPKADKPKRQKVFRINTELVRSLYDKQMTDKEIAAQMGLNVSTIWNWRKANSLPSHYKRPCSKNTKGSVSTTKKIAENHVEILESKDEPHSIPQGALSNPVLVKIQAIMDMISPEVSDQVSGLYLDLMVTMLSDEIQRIVNAK